MGYNKPIKKKKTLSMVQVLIFLRYKRPHQSTLVRTVTARCLVGFRLATGGRASGLPGKYVLIHSRSSNVIKDLRYYHTVLGHCDA